MRLALHLTAGTFGTQAYATAQASDQRKAFGQRCELGHVAAFIRPHEEQAQREFNACKRKQYPAQKLRRLALKPIELGRDFDSTPLVHSGPLAFDMSGCRRQAKLAGGRALYREVRLLTGHGDVFLGSSFALKLPLAHEDADDAVRQVVLEPPP